MEQSDFVQATLDKPILRFYQADDCNQAERMTVEGFLEYLRDDAVLDQDQAHTVMTDLLTHGLVIRRDETGYYGALLRGEQMYDVEEEYARLREIAAIGAANRAVLGMPDSVVVNGRRYTAR